MSYFDMMIDIIEEEPFKYEFVDIVILGFIALCIGIIYNIIVPHITL